MIKTVLIDDEIKSCRVLSSILDTYCKDVNVLGMAHNSEKACELIRATDPDLVFLDVQMPKGDGFSILEKLHPFRFKVIFLTAYDQFAIRAIRFSALDYLLKPVDIDELLQAIERFKQQRETSGSFREIQQDSLLQHLINNLGRQDKKAWDTLALPTLDSIRYVNLDEIVYAEANGNYSVFHLEGGEKITVSYTLKTYEDLLCASHFMRVHHSHILNLKKVKKYVRGKGGYAVMSNGTEIEISIRRKDHFLSYFPQ